MISYLTLALLSIAIATISQLWRRVAYWKYVNTTTPIWVLAVLLLLERLVMMTWFTLIPIVFIYANPFSLPWLFGLTCFVGNLISLRFEPMQSDGKTYSSRFNWKLNIFTVGMYVYLLYLIIM